MTKLEAAIYKDLCYNLNKWKRVEGDDFAEANEHFYEEVFTKDRLSDLGEERGFYYPDWGSLNEKTGEIYGGKVVAGGRYTAVGLRWAFDHPSWEGKDRKAASKKLRMKEGILIRPQIVLTLRPQSVLQELLITRKDEFTVASGNNRKLSLAKILDIYEETWRKVKLYPLWVALPITGRRQQKADEGATYRANVKPSEKSRHYKVDEPRNMEEEKQLTERFINLGRHLYEDAVKKGLIQR